MKLLLTSLFLSLSLSAIAQQSTTSMIHTSIDDDEKTMSISVDGTVNGRAIAYNRRFTIAGMSGAEKNALKNRVFDSLGLGDAPRSPRIAVPPPAPGVLESGEAVTEEATVTFVCKTCTGRIRLEVSGTNFSLTRETNSKNEAEKVFPMIIPMAPGEYRYTYWQNGVQQMQLPFVVKTGAKNEVVVK
jgi:hypothetical protein